MTSATEMNQGDQDFVPGNNVCKISYLLLLQSAPKNALELKIDNFSIVVTDEGIEKKKVPMNFTERIITAVKQPNMYL